MFLIARRRKKPLGDDEFCRIATERGFRRGSV